MNDPKAVEGKPNVSNPREFHEPSLVQERGGTSWPEGRKPPIVVNNLSTVLSFLEHSVFFHMVAVWYIYSLCAILSWHVSPSGERRTLWPRFKAVSPCSSQLTISFSFEIYGLQAGEEEEEQKGM